MNDLKFSLYLVVLDSKFFSFSSSLASLTMSHLKHCEAEQVKILPVIIIQ